MPVLVLDAHSTDRTAQIAREAGATVVRRAWTNFVDARLFALAHVETPWTLMIDADEELDAPLRAAIAEARGADCFSVSRTTLFCGRPMRMWSDEPLLRLFRTGTARLEALPATGGGTPLHERWVAQGPVARLAGTLVHHSYPTVRSYRNKFARYTTIESQRAGRGSPFMLVVRAPVALARFAYTLFLRGGIRDGWPGLYVALFSALYPLAVAHKRYWKR